VCPLVCQAANKRIRSGKPPLVQLSMRTVVPNVDERAERAVKRSKLRVEGVEVPTCFRWRGAQLQGKDGEVADAAISVPLRRHVNYDVGSSPDAVNLNALLVFLLDDSLRRHLVAECCSQIPVDILSDAIIAILERRRKWIKAKVDFMPFLLGVLKSLTSHIRTGKPLDAFDEIAPNPVHDEDDAEDSVEQISTAAPVDPERQLLGSDLDKQVRKRFDDDPEVLLVYEAFLEKMKPAEIELCRSLSEKEYNAAAKRLQRAVQGLAEGRPR